MKRSVGEIAKWLGISGRTLHYYDEIGLLKPSEVTPAGYRYYDEDDLRRLQQILFYRELEFSLRDIAAILSSPDHDQKGALEKHRELLLLKRRHLDELISLVENTLEGADMKTKAMTADEIDAVKKQYADEARQRWGTTTAYAESETKYASYNEEEKIALGEEASAIFAAFAALRQLPPDHPEAQTLVAKWRDYITKHHYACSKEILTGLGAMYVADERFKANLDAYGQGTAAFMAAAIAIYCS